MQALARPFGLIGGLGVAATVHYYRQAVRAIEGAGFVPRIAMVHADMQRGLRYVQAGRLDELAGYLAGIIGQLKAAGAEFAVIPAITPHICATELRAVSPLPFVDILDTTMAEIRARGLRRVGMFGTRFSVQSRLFGRLGGVDVVGLDEGTVAAVHDAYMRAVNEGDVAAIRAKLSGIADRILKEGAEAILLAGTDLAPVFNETNAPFLVVDCAAAHLAEIVRRALADA